MSAKARWYKVLIDGKSCHGGSLEWSLPRKVRGKWKPGEWHRVTPPLSVCERGLHVTKEPYQHWYKWGCTVYEAEIDGAVIHDDTKSVVEACRLLRVVERPSWEAEVQRFVDSMNRVPWMRATKPVRKEWRVFETWDAAGAAARAAAWAAARAAAWDAAWAAARNAADHAARNAADHAARDAADHAAWDAADHAAWDAAGAAARAAAWAAARAAARDAAGAAARIIAGSKLAAKHRDHLRERWEVWQHGYGLLCDVAGVLYVYKKL